MANSTVWVPTLSAKGWVKTLEEVIDITLSHTLVADYSQSNLHEVTSFSWLVATYGNNPARLTEEAENAYKKLLNKYAERVDVDVTYKLIENSDKYELIVKLAAYSGGKQYALSEKLEILDSTFVRVAELSNGTQST